jgi:hypothetical protein
MRIQQVILLLSASLSSGTAFAQGTAIPIANPLFLEDQLSCSPGAGCYTSQNISEWLCGPVTSIAKLSTEQYPAAPPQGILVAALGYTQGTGSIQQTLSDTVQANTNYVLKIEIGARADVPFTGYLASLKAGNVVLASSSKATPTGGTFVTDAITYSSGANPPQLGKPLQISVKSLGFGQVNIRAVSLTAEQ